MGYSKQICEIGRRVIDNCLIQTLETKTNTVMISMLL